MKKRFTRTLAMLLVLVMVFSVLPLSVFAADVEEGSAATLITTAPADGSYGVIFNPGTDGKTGYVMGFDISDGNCASKHVSLSSDGKRIENLPDGTAIVKFIKNSDGTYYFTLGGKYLAIQDTSEGTEKMILLETPETGSKWTISADRGGMANAYNIMNAEYKWNGSSDVYLEQYNGQKYCGYSYKGDTPQYFQMKFATTAADDDGRVGEIQEAGPAPVDGDTVVIYNRHAKGVFGQPTGPDAAKPNLTAAAAELTTDGTLPYANIGDGGLIFTVHVSGTEYTFQTGGKYLGMTENKEDGTNDESLILVDAENDYTKWTMSEISGGWLIKNKAATWKGYPVYIEFFDDLFAGYSYNAGSPEIFAMRFYHVDDQYNCGYVVNPNVYLSKTPDPAIGSDCPVEFTVNDLNDITATSIRYWFDGKTYTAKTATAEYNNKVGTFTIPAAHLNNHKTLTIEIKVTDSMNLKPALKETLDIRDEPLILEVSPAPNSATGEVLRPEISVTFSNVGTNPTFELKLDDEIVTGAVSGSKYVYTPAEDMTVGKHSLAVTITRADGKSVIRNWTFFIGEGGETLYFGQIHSHTAEYSDGAGQLEDAYQHAHEAKNVDFLIVTDHSNYFDTTATATTSSYYDLSSLAKNAAGTTTKWEEARATAKAYNEQWDDFICLYGYEMTWSGGPGHTNTFNTYGTVSRNNKDLNDKTGYAGMHLYNDLMSNADKGLDVNGEEAKTARDGAEVTGVNATKDIPFDEAGKPVPVVSQFNHPGTTFGNFDNFAGCTATRDDVLNLIEVGNGEGKVGGSSYFPSYEQYDLCLSMGWHVAPTNNQDNHKGNWGDSNTCRDVILTDDFSEIGIYRALDARHVYSTEDQNLEISYELEANGSRYQLGDIAPIEDADQPDQITFYLTINDPDNESIGRIQIIGEGAKVLKEITVTGNSYKDEIVLDHKDAKGDVVSGYYYIKVIEGDGNIAVTAPVWTAETVPVNIDAKTSAAVAAQGEEETITATITNGSSGDALTLVSCKITADGDVILDRTLNETVNASTAKTVTTPYTPKTTNPAAQKTYDIVVEFTFTYKGKTQTYTKTLTETSYPPEMMTYIGLDKGHTNFYVSGDYAGNESSFIQICADNGIIVEYIEAGQMTKEKLAKYKMVVLTVPRVDENTKPTVWTKAELAAIADYAANGGNIINLSKSDRYDYKDAGADGNDTYQYASATISNLVNEAVGAKTRFVRGIVVDNEMMSNVAYRINFNGKELLGDHEFTTGIFASSNGQYQYYNGTGIVTEAGAENDVTPLVMPYQSTWVACYKDNFTGASYVPDYNKDTVMAEKDSFNLVTVETLSGGGFLVCGGACFISNYDLMAGTPSNEQFENYGLVMNILKHVKNGDEKPTITPIKDVHKGTVGQEFTVEGVVTSNASDYDKTTAFFDCIYVQDETRGINCFPVSGYYYIGEHVRIHGGVTYYCGEIELNLGNEYNGSIEVISNDINPAAPKNVSCKQAMSDDNIGNLMRIFGKIVEIHKTSDVIDYIYVDDGSGEVAALFINGYIQSSYTGLDEATVGMYCEGIGIGSRDVNEGSGDSHDDSELTPDQFIKRLRVRAREEIRISADPCFCFTDVKTTSWYHEGVDYVVANGIMNGTTTTTFAPNDSLTREQFVTILWRLAGEPAHAVSNPFTDVKASNYSYDAILWAYENHITSGSTPTTFDRKGNVTRQQLAAFLYRYADYAGYDVSARADLSAFPDLASVSSYAVDPVSWANAAGLIVGDAQGGVNYLHPKNNTTRAQIAVILLRFSKISKS